MHPQTTSPAKPSETQPDETEPIQTLPDATKPNPPDRPNQAQPSPTHLANRTRPSFSTQPGCPPAHRSCIHDVQRQSCFILGLLAVKPEYQARISRAGALAGLVRLLREANERLTTGVARGTHGGGAARRAADAITNLAHENSEIKVSGASVRT
eukprot:364271-Chlamydomonas_euryale.AAC.5